MADPCLKRRIVEPLGGGAVHRRADTPRPRGSLGLSGAPRQARYHGNVLSLVECDPRSADVARWFGRGDPLRLMVRPWFDAVRACGADVRECLHDGRPTACLGDAAFAYADAYKAHASLGFFCGANLPDPGALLSARGKRMRHVRLDWSAAPQAAALLALITAAYRDIRLRVAEAP